MRKKQTEQSKSETEKSKINLERAEQLKAILDSEVFNDAVEELKADLLIRTMQVYNEMSVMDMHRQVKAIDAIVQKLKTDYTDCTGEYD